MDHITDDAIFHGALRLKQRRRGYRFTEDAVLLAAFASRGPRAATAVDLGAGCGVVGLMLLRVRAAERFLAIELQRGLSGLAAENGRSSCAPAQLVVLRGDLRRAPIATGTADLVVSNPPYTPLGVGRPPPDRERALSRHEIACTPEALAAEASRLLGPSGRLAVVYPAERSDDVLAAMGSAGLVPTRRRMVCPGPGRTAALVLVEARRRHDGAMIDEPPLVTRDESGAHVAEMAALLAGRFDGWAVSHEAGRP